MRKKIIILMTICMIGVLSGCSNNEGSTGAVEIDTKQFEVLSNESLGTVGDSDDELIIIKHKETGKRFIIYKGFRKGGITPLD